MLELSVTHTSQGMITMARASTELEPVLLADRLRDETRAQHEAVEATPFSKLLLSQSLPLDAYKEQLWLYHQVLAVLEAELRRCDHPILRSLWDEKHSRLTMLCDDLDWLQVSTPSDSVCAPARELQSWIQTIVNEDPVCLVGVWYVFEGSSLGGVFMSRLIAEQYGFTNRGYRYYSGHGSDSANRWRAYRSALNSLPLSANETTRVVQAAGVTFGHIGRLLGALIPV